MGNIPRLVILDRVRPGAPANPAPEMIVSGIPRARLSNQYEEASKQFYCGLWSSTAGRWRVRYTEHEFCVMVEGRVRIESADGDRHDFRPGDAFVIPAGFEGTWEVLEPCKKWYAMFEPRAGA